MMLEDWLPGETMILLPQSLIDSLQTNINGDCAIAIEHEGIRPEAVNTEVGHIVCCHCKHVSWASMDS
jgi:hypothetical protein